MATVNIANLTFSHKGNYDGSTAYVKNDVVYYSTNGNAYIAKQNTTGNAPTNGTYWSQFAAGSGGIWNAGLSLGSAGQAVKVNAAGNALEFGAISSAYKKLSYYSNNTRVVSAQNSGDTDVFTATSSYVKDDASTKLKIFARTPIHNPQQGAMQLQVKFTHTDGTETHFYGARGYVYTGQANSSILDCAGVLTGMKAGTYTIIVRHSSRGNNHNGGHTTNPNSSDDNRYEGDTDVQGQANNNSSQSRSVVIIEEIE